MCFSARCIAICAKKLAVLVRIHLSALAVVEHVEGELYVGANRDAPPTSLICI